MGTDPSCHSLRRGAATVRCVEARSDLPQRRRSPKLSSQPSRHLKHEPGAAYDQPIHEAGIPLKDDRASFRGHFRGQTLHADASLHEGSVPT